MEKTVSRQDLVVEKIILSFGINGRANQSKETTIKNVQAALRATKHQFPYAEIWIPLVKYSTQLPQEEQDNLQLLNEHVERNMPHIPLLPERKFHMQADDIHWTRETGTAIFNHWMDFLNPGNPLSPVQVGVERPRSFQGENVVNLAKNFTLSEPQYNLLSRGLSFIPIADIGRNQKNTISMGCTELLQTDQIDQLFSRCYKFYLLLEFQIGHPNWTNCLQKLGI